MKIDFFKLNNLNKVSFDEDITIDSSFYEKMDIINIEDVHACGEISINCVDEIELLATVTGIFTIPCAVTLEPVKVPFTSEIDENIGKFEDFYNKNKNSLDILPIIWENIVLEVPMRVVKEGVSTQDINGDGWELVSS